MNSSLLLAGVLWCTTIFQEMATDFASRTEEHILDALSSPGTLEKFANPEPSTDASTDPDQHVFPTDGDPLDAPSFPTPDSANSEPNMDVSNDLTQQSGDNNVSCDIFYMNQHS